MSNCVAATDDVSVLPPRLVATLLLMLLNDCNVAPLMLRTSSPSPGSRIVIPWPPKRSVTKFLRGAAAAGWLTTTTAVNPTTRVRMPIWRAHDPGKPRVGYIAIKSPRLVNPAIVDEFTSYVLLLQSVNSCKTSPLSNRSFDFEIL